VSDYFEIDFLDVESKKSGDAITMRYGLDGRTYIHVVDAGFQATGDSVVSHLDNYYGNSSVIDHVVLTHSDGDHAGGLRTVLEKKRVTTLWMLRPWLYASELLHRFPKVSSVPTLVRILREAYPNIAALEEIALQRKIPIMEPFQGARIGAFVVMAPSKQRYLDLLARSECTPESDAKGALFQLKSLMRKTAAYVVALARAAWGEENFSPDDVSAENEMSVVQYARLAGTKILLTADAGREGLSEAIAFAPQAGLDLPGINRFQVPHHGSRRNVSTEILDRLLGARLPAPLPTEQSLFTAIISSAKEDEAHPRKAVVRGMIHRGAKTISTEGKSVRISHNAPARPDWGPVVPMSYPEEQERD
jgi:beta-lactamase superfamily II metal-dependent hydrolase